jgi:hypothetical protein
MRRFIVLTAVLLCLVSSAPAQVSYEGYADPMDLVDHWYQTFLHRSGRADPSSYSWAQQLQQGAAPNAVLAGILSSDEYYAKGGSTPEGFIRNLYADIIVRQPTASELQYWMQRALTQNIADPETRKDMAYDILTNNPGSAQWSYTTPPVLPTQPGYDRDRERGREREHERDKYDYRRPQYPYRH